MTIHELTKRLAQAGAAAAVAGALAFPAHAQRAFAVTTLSLDPSASVGTASVARPGVVTPESVRSAASIADGMFTRLDLRIVIREDNVDAVRRMVDQGYTSEASRCAPGAYGPLDMEEGLRYFFDLSLIGQGGADGERYIGTVYPGDRGVHWTNDVFCEYDPALGEEAAVLRITGFFYVIHRRVREGWDVQLRAVTLSQEEIDEYTGSHE